MFLRLMDLKVIKYITQALIHLYKRYKKNLGQFWIKKASRKANGLRKNLLWWNILCGVHGT